MRTCDECGVEIRKENRTGFCLEHSLTARGQVKRDFKASVQVMLQNRVDRDPCPYCAVRGGIGCRHQRRAA